MSNTIWDPLKSVAALHNQISKVFEEAPDKTEWFDDASSCMCAWKPPVDIYETGEGIVLIAELPGLAKEDVSLEVKENILSIKGERCMERKHEQRNFFRKERCFGTFHRAFKLEGHVNPQNIKAKFKDGLLEILVPTYKDHKTGKVKVDID
ncbi:Hsp20/alpha crystallin family protein [Desulfobacterales bacterium HSG16]|nr:Hsp20/alpha crystallin family protein [Desulfobacterales bacterium HSG16]